VEGKEWEGIEAGACWN